MGLLSQNHHSLRSRWMVVRSNRSDDVSWPSAILGPMIEKISGKFGQAALSNRVENQSAKPPAPVDPITENDDSRMVSCYPRGSSYFLQIPKPSRPKCMFDLASQTLGVRKRDILRPMVGCGKHPHVAPQTEDNQQHRTAFAKYNTNQSHRPHGRLDIFQLRLRPRIAFDNMVAFGLSHCVG